MAPVPVPLVKKLRFRFHNAQCGSYFAYIFCFNILKPFVKLVASIIGYGWFDSLRGLILYCDFVGLQNTGIIMSTIPTRKQKRSDIEANYRNETKPFWCVPKKQVERFYLVQKLWIEIITFWCVPEPLRSKSGRFC